MANSVLIIEDNEHVREIFVSMLRSAGYEILDAGTGTQGIEKALSAKPNLILLDLDLPDMTGMDTAKAIRKNSSTAHIPIIACSAWSGREWREEALRAGMVDYLQKPIPSELIKAKVREFILP
ncbi:MAG TPA: response regulator [Candidatus Binatia bacterium]|jgi:CheY-like chemotaxis protein|nr:response regulator [Candidatus Binatia bacterium]